MKPDISIPAEVTMDNSLRIKITDNCSLSCNFCHNEGTLVRPCGKYRPSVFSKFNGANFIPGEMQASQDFIDSVNVLCLLFGLNTIHLTGGGPLQSRYIQDIVFRLKSEGYKVKITSNGDTPKEKLSKLTKGLDGITFSVLGINPEDFIKTQTIESSINQELASRKLQKLQILFRQLYRRLLRT